MNFYNPYVTNFQTGLTTTPAAAFQSSLAFQQNLLAPLYLNSLNQKRSLDTLNGVHLDSDSFGWEPKKKLKLNNELPEFKYFQPTINQAIKNNPLTSHYATKEIPVVDLEDDCLILGSTSHKNNNLHQQSIVDNQLLNLNLLQMAQSSFSNSGSMFQKDPFTQMWNPANSQNALLGELIKQSGSLNLVQQLSQRDEILSQILNSNNSSQLFQQEQAKQNYKNQEIIIIDEDDSTCQTTPQSAGEGSLKKIEFNLNPVKQDFVQSLEKLRVEKASTKTKKEANKKVQENSSSKFDKKLSPQPKEEIKEELKFLQTQAKDESGESKTDVYAVIPAFNVPREGKRRTPQLKWDPTSQSAAAYRKGFDTIQNIVGIEITNEAKIIEALKEYDMNLEVAYEKIKRNKASYRNYFRVQRSLRSNSLLR